MLFDNSYNQMNVVYDSLNNNIVGNNSFEDKFFRGNMFDDEYLPYKDYKVDIFTGKSEKEVLLIKIMKLCFSLNDYNLWLDLHPNDREILLKYKKIHEELKEITKMYEQKYGPLTSSNVTGDTFSWVDAPWPWERGINFYV